MPLATIAWQKKDTPSNDATGMSVTHEYVLAYQRSDGFKRQLLPRTEEQLENYKNPDNDPRGPWTRTSLIRKEAREAGRYPVRNAAGRERTPPPGTSWRVPPDRFAEYDSDKRIWWGQDGDGDLPFLKRFLSEVQDGTVPITWWDYEFAGSNRNAKVELRDLFDQEVPFDSPKPVLLIDRCLQIATGRGTNEIVLDCFAGSGTTAHAVERPKVTVIAGEMKVGKAGVDAKAVSAAEEVVTSHPNGLPDILAYLQNETELTRSTLVRILVESGRLAEVFNDPQRFMDAVASVLKHELRALLVDGIKYERLPVGSPGGEWEMLLFENEEVVNYPRHHRRPCDHHRRSGLGLFRRVRRSEHTGSRTDAIA